MPTIVSDQIMALRTPDRAFGKARVLVADDNTVAVFTRSSGPPSWSFTFTTRAARSFTLADGTVVQARAVGSSCSWPLARCRVSTTQLAARWNT